MVNGMAIIIKMITNDIHIGDNTHHQDHVITFVSLSTINTIVNKPVKPIPEFDVFVSLIVLIFIIN